MRDESPRMIRPDFNRMLALGRPRAYPPKVVLSEAIMDYIAMTAYAGVAGAVGRIIAGIALIGAPISSRAPVDVDVRHSNRQRLVR